MNLLTVIVILKERMFGESGAHGEAVPHFEVQLTAEVLFDEAPHDLEAEPGHGCEVEVLGQADAVIAHLDDDIAFLG